MSNRKMRVLRYYEWGNEKPGYVSTWRIINDQGEWKHCGERSRDQLPKNAIHECPFN